MQKSNVLAEAFREAPKVRVDKIGLGVIVWGSTAIGLAPAAFALSGLGAWLLVVALCLVVTVVNLAPRHFDTLATYNPSVSEFLLAGLGALNSSATVGLGWMVLYGLLYLLLWGITGIVSLFAGQWQLDITGISFWISTIVASMFAALYLIGTVDTLKEQLYPDRAWTHSVYYVRTVGMGPRVYRRLIIYSLLLIDLVWLAIVFLTIDRETAIWAAYIVFQFSLIIVGSAVTPRSETPTSKGRPDKQHQTEPQTNGLPSWRRHQTQKSIGDKDQVPAQHGGLVGIRNLISPDQQTSNLSRASVVEAVSKVLQESGYEVHISPRTGNPDLDSFATNVDVLAHDDVNAVAIQVKTNEKYSDPVEWTVAANLQLSAKVLAAEVLPDEYPAGKAPPVEPVLVLVGREPADSLRSFSQKEGIRVVALSAADITAISVNKADDNRSVAEMLMQKPAAIGNQTNENVQASTVDTEASTNLPGVSQ